MSSRFSLLALALAIPFLPACDEQRKREASGSSAAPREEEPETPNPHRSGKQLVAYAPPTDFMGASPEDAANGASALFDGTRMRDAVNGGPGGALGAPGGKRLCRSLK